MEHEESEGPRDASRGNSCPAQITHISIRQQLTNELMMPAEIGKNRGILISI